MNRSKLITAWAVVGKKGKVIVLCNKRSQAMKWIRVRYRGVGWVVRPWQAVRLTGKVCKGGK